MTSRCRISRSRSTWDKTPAGITIRKLSSRGLRKRSVNKRKRKSVSTMKRSARNV